ncbi:YggL 50S ribosome-binding family protein [Paraburkholderia solisilvae]|uniref:DUF469 domain-containing protein n=1 Tax=Paraburkholderia solisilvae TaxID=624376 RepID=A0A6J5EL43_9BURK|nr:YggL family protein [Paraburkholderia solisilvae]CAB3766474.1 hypothetical protein LMG29739_04841 [Paraburkholderia solisilvae]
MSMKHNKRQRKKLHIGEFQEMGFHATADLSHPLDEAQRDALIDAFLEQCIEANDMLFGGGINRDLDGYIVADGKRKSATDEQRECVRQWLEGRPDFTAVRVEPLTDAWYGHD